VVVSDGGRQATGSQEEEPWDAPARATPAWPTC
jgi:hypothetical protein